MNKLNFVLVIAFVTSLQACTPDTALDVESGLDETEHGQVQIRGAGTGGNREYQFDRFSVIVKGE